MFKWLFGGQEEKYFNISLVASEKFSFRATTINEMKNNGLTLMNNNSDYIFDVVFLKEVNNHYLFEWQTMYKKLFQGMEYLSEHFEILHYIMSIKDRLVLEINNDGLIVKVHNKDELQAKWQGLKTELLSNLEMIPIAESYRNQFFSDGDSEFSLQSSLEEALNQDQLYSTFFRQFALTKNRYGNDVILRDNRNSLFIKYKDQPLMIPIVQTSNWKKDNNLINFLINESADNSRLDKGKMRDFLQTLAMVNPEVKSYSYENQINYMISEDSFEIKEMKNTLFENINNNIEMYFECQIMKIYG